MLNTHIPVKLKDAAFPHQAAFEQVVVSLVTCTHVLKRLSFIVNSPGRHFLLTSCVLCCSSLTNISLSHVNDLISSHRFSFINEALSPSVWIMNI